LNCEHAFDVMRGEVESELFSKFTFFIEQTVKTIRLDIAPVAAKQTLGSAESKKIVDAMESFMPMIATLPLDVGQRALALANSTVVASVERHLGSQEVKVVSTEGLLQLRVDLALIEQCLQKFTVFSTDTANDAFAPLKQLLDLFLYDDWATLFTTYTNADSVYKRVSLDTTAKVLAKYRESDDKTRSSVFVAMKTDRDKKKRKETIMAQLSELRGNKLPLLRTTRRVPGGSISRINL
ncbi:hypothetical protein RvY_19430-2, partial [Ramazzottius varieornatus]